MHSSNIEREFERAFTDNVHAWNVHSTNVIWIFALLHKAATQSYICLNVKMFCNLVQDVEDGKQRQIQNVIEIQLSGWKSY